MKSSFMEMFENLIFGGFDMSICPVTSYDSSGYEKSVNNSFPSTVLYVNINFAFSKL